MNGYKKCTRCGITKPLNDYYVDITNRNYLSWCKPCHNEYSRNYNQQNKDKRIYPRSQEPKICKVCKILKPAEDFYGYKRNKDGLMGKCKECHHLHDPSLNPLRTPEERAQIVLQHKLKKQQKEMERERVRKEREQKRQERIDSLSKFCPFCNETKLKTLFNRDSKSLDGRSNKCKACKKIYDREMTRTTLINKVHKVLFKII